MGAEPACGDGGQLSSGGRVAAALGIALVLGLAAPAAAQQNPDLRALIERVDRLHTEVQDFQKMVARGGTPTAVPAPAAAPAPAPGNDEATARAARFELRLGTFEEELRRLTGKIEEASHRVDTLGERLDRLAADVDFRLSAIEKRLAAAPPPTAAATPPATAAPAGAPAPTAAAPATAAAATPATPPPPRQPGILGTIPQSALNQGAAATPPATPKAPPTPKATPALPPGTPEQQYKYAYDLLRQAEYDEAARALQAFIAAHPDHTLTGNAYYWLAETFYVRGDYEQAAVYFARGFEKFPKGAKAPDNLLKLALSLVHLKREDDACVTFKELADRFPDAPAAIQKRAREESGRLACE